jgi:hypothetical protein
VIDGSLGVNSIAFDKICHTEICLHGSSRDGPTRGIYEVLGIRVLFVNTGEKAGNFTLFSGNGHVAALFKDEQNGNTLSPR